MRLIYCHTDGTLELKAFNKRDIPPYAILSHTWSDDEVTFQHFLEGTSASHQGFEKISFCQRQALKDGLKHIWIDTCCIDKQNHAELSEAINSMFLWYSRASKCYAHLSDVSSLDPKTGKMHPSNVWMDDFQRSRWFTRGWTLQELIAPGSVEFFSAEGHLLGNKRSLELKIAQITSLPTDALRGQPLHEFSVRERFAWAEYRETTKEEDKAYCPCGIFDIFMPLLYGEGQDRARKRLQKHIHESQEDENDELGYHSGDELGSSAFPGDYKAYKRSLDTDEISAYKRRCYDNRTGSLRSRAALVARSRKATLGSATLPVLDPWHQALCLSQDISIGSDSELIFHAAHISFLDAVYWDEWPHFETFTNRQEMMADILAHCHKVRDSSRLITACQIIDNFSARWAPFFTAVTFAVKVNPEWYCTLWGAIRLVFVVCETTCMS